MKEQSIRREGRAVGAGGAPRSLWPWLAKALPKVQGGRADPVQALTPPQGPLASQKFNVYSDQREPCVPLVCVHNVFYSSAGRAVGRALADLWGLGLLKFWLETEDTAQQGHSSLPSLHSRPPSQPALPLPTSSLLQPSQARRKTAGRYR